MAPEAARTQAKILLGTVANGADPAAEKRAKRPKAEQLTFDDLAQRYLDEYAKPRKSSWKNDRNYLKRPRAKWKRRPASDITDDDAAELIEEIGTTAPVSANRIQSILHTVFSWAAEPGRKHVKDNPMRNMRQRYVESPRERILDDGEIKTLWWDWMILACPPVVQSPSLSNSFSRLWCGPASPSARWYRNLSATGPMIPSTTSRRTG
jgi:hypothetical protein